MRDRNDWKDLSPEEIAFSRRLQAWFDLEQEALPPFYLDTLNNQVSQQASLSATSLEERITQRVFDRLGLPCQRGDPPPLNPSQNRPRLAWEVLAKVYAVDSSPLNPSQARPWSEWGAALTTGILALVLILATVLFCAPVQDGARTVLETLSQPAARPTRTITVEKPKVRSFATIWEAQPYVDFPITHLQRIPPGFRLEEVRIRGSFAAALIYRHWNEQTGRWERLVLLEYRSEAVVSRSTPFPTPQVVGPEQQLDVAGMDITLTRHEATPDAEGMARARWRTDGISFNLYGPLSTKEVQALAEEVLQTFDQ